MLGGESPIIPDAGSRFWSLSRPGAYRNAVFPAALHLNATSIGVVLCGLLARPVTASLAFGDAGRDVVVDQMETRFARHLVLAGPAGPLSAKRHCSSRPSMRRGDCQAPAASGSAT